MTHPPFDGDSDGGPDLGDRQGAHNEIPSGGVPVTATSDTAASGAGTPEPGTPGTGRPGTGSPGTGIHATATAAGAEADAVTDAVTPVDGVPVPEPAGDMPVEAPLPTSWLRRAWRRVTRRPRNWWNQEWTNERIAAVVFTSTVLVVTTVIMMLVVHFNPLSPSDNLVMKNTTPTGGDMGAHVWAPAYLRDHLLNNLRLSGWSMDWYAGLPVYRFYMVTPALAIVALDVLLPYGIAFKLVAVSGLVLFPLACWTFGRLAAFRRPIPELLAVGGLCFLLDESFSIYGGNLKSTMAGEFSFSIALTLAMFGLGLLANGLRTGKFRVSAAIVLSLAAVSHGIVLIFVAVSAIVLSIVWIDRKRLVYALTTGVTTLLLSAWWVGPFLFAHEYMTDMKYGARPDGANDSFWDMFFPLTSPLDFLITTLAIVGFAAFVARRQLTGTAMGIICLVFVALVYLTRDSLPIIGLLWNPRLLPFVYLMRYLLMVVGAYEILIAIVNIARGRLVSDQPGIVASSVSAGVVVLGCLVVLGFMYETLPFDGRVTDGDTTVYAWGPFRKPVPSGDGYNSRAVGDGWSRYNFEGYEGRPSYPEYRDLVTTMDQIGQERGCGRATWENSSDNGEYGTTMALMLLPFWTDSCIASMEGLYFEASGTTPYHFLTTAAVSSNASNPVRQLRYVDNDMDVGIEHLRDLGVKYLMVRTDDAKAEAEGHDGLELITTVGPWEIYEVLGISIVEPLAVQPVVVNERSGDQRERHLEVGTSWFQNQESWAAMPADSGPESWQRIDVEVDLDQRVGEPDSLDRKVDIVNPVQQIDVVELPEVTVSNVEVGDESVSFDVDKVGVPVLVRVSYFPNWEASGAEGPYRVAPNFMVVVPTSNHVELNYARTNQDLFFYALTLVGIALCFYWRHRGDVVYDDERPAAVLGAVADVRHTDDLDPTSWYGSRVEPIDDLDAERAPTEGSNDDHTSPLTWEDTDPLGMKRPPGPEGR